VASEYKTGSSISVFYVSARLNVKNRGTWHLTKDRPPFCVWCKFLVISARKPQWLPPLRNCLRQPAIRGMKKEIHLRVVRSVPRWKTSATPDLRKHVREIAPRTSLECTQKQDRISSASLTSSPYHGYKLPIAPHSVPAGFMGLAVGYITFPFSGNPSAPHYPPF
jgi:hypothetical protein